MNKQLSDIYMKFYRTSKEFNVDEGFWKKVPLNKYRWNQFQDSNYKGEKGMLNRTAQIQMKKHNYGEFRGRKTNVKNQCIFGSCRSKLKKIQQMIPI